MVSIYDDPTFRNCYLDLAVYGIISAGGSNGYGSDEPPWLDVEIDDVRRADGRKISKRLEHALLAEFGDVWAEKLLEESNEY